MSATVAYVAALDRALVGPARARRELVREAEDHLVDATDAYRRAGYEPQEAERQAVDDFGRIDQVAPAFQTTLSVAAARRTARLLLGVLMAQPFLWDGPIVVGDPGTAPANPVYAALDQGVEVLGGISLVAAVVLLGATTLGARWVRPGRGVARATSWVAITAALALSVMGGVMSVLSSGMAAAYWLMVVTCLFAPMAAVTWSARRTLVAC